MRFGISATSWIFPKNFLTRLRPVNVCAAISVSLLSNRRARATLRKAAIHRDRQDRRLGPLLLFDSATGQTFGFLLLPSRNMSDSGNFAPGTAKSSSHLLEFHLGADLFQRRLDLFG